MRLHSLRVEAFGPFAGVEEVDFDALTSSGLFLLYGPTGAGKTSVLDAVCFALFGCVPGDRASTSLRSDHAEPAAAPRVVCEFSVAARRLRVTRSPAWDRPKRRGSGTTKEQARISVEERRGSGWMVLTERLDEAGHMLSDLIGMGLDAFTKVVLLPQGEFAAFLRADAETRRALLERLFGTDRFGAIQQWLRQRRCELAGEVDRAARLTDSLVARAEQACAPTLTAGWADVVRNGNEGENSKGEVELYSKSQVDPKTEPPTTHPAMARVRDLGHAVSWALDDATCARESARSRRTNAEQALATAEVLAARQGEATALAARAEALACGQADHERMMKRLRDHDRAAGLAFLAGAMRSAQRDADAASDALGQTDSTPDEPDDVVEQQVAAAQAERAGLDADWRAGADADVARADHERKQRAADDLADRSRALRETIGAAVVALADIQSSILRLRAAADAAPGTMSALDDAQRRLDDVLARDRLRTRVERLRQRRDVARAADIEAREHLLDLRERRLSGMAAELAAALAAGQPCRVCGSADHPAPAVGAQDAVSARDEQDAATAADSARAALTQAQSDLAAARAALEVVGERAGEVNLAHAQEALAKAQADAEAAREAVQRLSDLQDRQIDLARRRDAAAAQEEGLRPSIAAAVEAAAQARARALQAVENWALACGDDASPAARRVRLDAAVRTGQARLAARARHRQAASHVASLTTSATTAARAAGFADAEQALAAVLSEQEQVRLTEAVSRYEAESAEVAAGLRRPEIVAAHAAAPADVAAARACVEMAVTDDEAAASRLTVATTAVAAIGALESELAEHLRACAPVMEAHARLEELCRCVDGVGGDNARRMSLPAYVLAARLEQVAEAASLRLARMSGGRYTLVHSDDLERGGRRSGLSLHVVDSWTGLQRSTASLSGGETFYASLALALGLADVLSAEAAGTQVETLFVDEGFGSLDQDTFEEVLDALESLRAGGRAVGLVSHVADLQQRIPARLEVVKGRAGSHLRQVADQAAS